MRPPWTAPPDNRAEWQPHDEAVSDEVFERVDHLASEFLERSRRGERPTIAEYVDRHPELAQTIRELFPALVLVEQLKPDSDETTISPGPRDVLEEAPDRLGDYRILREVGRGGMGVVYEAEQESLGRRVALKVLASWAGGSENQIRRFHREARSAAQLHHTNIVPVYGVGEHGGRHFYTMQFIHGVGLHQILDEIRLQGNVVPDGLSSAADSLARSSDETIVHEAACSLRVDRSSAVDNGHLDWHRWSGTPDSLVGRATATAVDPRHRFARSVARVGMQVAEALAHAHGQGTLHRDIKPANILLDGHGNAWVTDFGLAKAVDDEDLTRTGDLVGTVRYMAPERFRGACDARSDVYALGLTLYELLAGRPAFADSDRHVLMRKVAQVDPPRLGSLAAGIPRDLATIVHKAIEKAPADRYPSASAMAADLRRFLDDRPIEARRIGPAERLLRWARRKPDLAGLVAAVAVLLVAIAAVSTAAAIRLRESRSEVEHQLWEAYLARARASRRSGAEGQRFDALDALTRAGALNVFNNRHDALRDEAIACLALADLRRIGERTLPMLESRRHPLAFAPDGRHFAIGDEGGFVRVLDPGSDRPAAILPGPGIPAVLMRFSPDGRRLAVRYDDGHRGVLRVFDLPRRGIVVDEPGRWSAAALTFDPLGRRLAAGLEDGTVRIHDLDGEVAPISLTTPPEPYSLCFDPTGRRIAVTRYEDKDSVLVLDVGSRDVVGRWAMPQGALGLAWSPDGGQLAAGGGYRDLFLIDPEHPEAPPRVLHGHKGAVVSLAYSHRGHLLASASWDGTVRLWHPESGETLVVASSPEHWSVRFSLDDRILSGGRDGATIWSWEVADGDEARCRYVDIYPDSRTWTVDFFPDGLLFASAGLTGLRLLDTELRQAAFLPVEGFATAAVAPDGRALLTGGPTGLHRWPIRRAGGELQVGPPSPFGPMPGRPTGRIRLDAEGRRVAAVLDDPPTMVAVFDANAGGPPTLIGNHPGLERIDLSPDGRLLVTGTWRGEGVKVWDTSTGALVADLDVEGSAEVDFSPDGRTLLTGSGRAYICWDLGAWSRSWELPRREASNQPGKIAFSADGALVAVAWTRTLVRLLDTRTGFVIATLETPSADHVAELGLSRDHSFLFVKDHGGCTRRWDLQAIRRRLVAMGIGWPELPPSGRDRRIPTAPPARVVPLAKP